MLQPSWLPASLWVVTHRRVTAASLVHSSVLSTPNIAHHYCAVCGANHASVFAPIAIVARRTHWCACCMSFDDDRAVTCHYNPLGYYCGRYGQCTAHVINATTTIWACKCDWFSHESDGRMSDLIPWQQFPTCTQLPYHTDHLSRQLRCICVCNR